MQFLPERTVKGVALAGLRILILTYVFFGLLLFVRQDAYLFIPPETIMEDCPELHDAVLIPMEGTRAYYLRSATSTRIAITYHGNGESACHSAALARWLFERGYNVLSVEYAGYAGDKSKPSVALLLQDVAHAVRWVDDNHFTEFLVVGRSIGAGFAAEHARLAPPDRLLLISPFDSLSAVAQGHFPLYPASLLLKTDLDNFAGASAAKRVLIVHGTEDVIIPLERGKSLYDQLPQQDKKFYVAEGYEHNDVLDSQSVWGEMGVFVE